MSKKKDKIRVRFIGKSAEDVTGSMILIEMQKYKILLETGLYQSNNVKEDYKINNRRLEFKPSEIDFVFICHSHIDHIGLLPRLYAEGCKAKVIVPKGTTSLFSIMSKDCAHIFLRDVETLQRKYGMDVSPIYTAEDAENCLKYFSEYDMNSIIKLNEDISFNFIPSGHIINAGQLELWLNENNRTVKIGYTSDIGNISIPKYYSGEFKPIEKCNLLIAENTYNDKGRISKLKDREKDLEKIKTVIDTVCCDNGHKVLIPIFSLDRCQNILTHLYNLYGKDKSFNIPIIVDSPLAVKISRLYYELLNDDDLIKYNEVMSWSNIHLVEEYAESKMWMDKHEPMILVSAAGMMTAGRARQWAKLLLPDALSHILFVGYSAVGSLSNKIKEGKKQKTIAIDGKAIPNRCGITNLLSFTSHIQYMDMINYYSNVNCEKIALVHGDFKNKIEFAKELQEEISKKNKCSKVTVVNKNTELLI